MRWERGTVPPACCGQGVRPRWDVDLQSRVTGDPHDVPLRDLLGTA